jgi:uncharacterized membrane protein
LELYRIERRSVPAKKGGDMGHVDAWIMDIIGPAILLIVLIWLVIRVRSNRDESADRRSEEATRELYAEEEERRREGTDKL